MERTSNSTKQKKNSPDELRVTDRRRINLEAPSSEEAPEGPSLKPTYVEELEARTKAAEKLVDDVQARFEQLRQKLQQETDETRQRLNRAAEEKAQREVVDFIASLLPVRDNLRRAIQAAEGGSSPEQITEGIRGTASSFENALAIAGVEAIVAVGQDFDPELHEAVDTAPVEKEREGKILIEYSTGFRMGQRLLRPAKVQVGRARAETREASQ